MEVSTEEAVHEVAWFNQISRTLRQYDEDSLLRKAYTPWLLTSKFVLRNAGRLSLLFSLLAFAGPLVVVRRDLYTIGESGLWPAILVGVASLFLSNRLEGYHAQVRTRAIAIEKAEQKTSEQEQRQIDRVRQKHGHGWRRRR